MEAEFTSIAYHDRVRYSEDAVQIAYRGGSLEINRLSATVYGYRFNRNGCWFIVSTQDGGHALDFNAVKTKAVRYLLDRRSCGGFAEAMLFKGHIEIGRETPQEDEVAELIRDLCDEVETMHSARCEAILYMKSIEREITRENSEVAHEIRRMVEIEIGLLKSFDITLQAITSSYTAIIPWTKEHVTKTIDVMFREAINKLNTSSRARTLKPYQYGRASVILGHEAASAFIHELSHLLEAGYLQYTQKLVGNLIAPRDFNLYDNPHDYDSPTIRFFDDECVSTRKRTLVEDGIVRDLHHTRTTAALHGSEPGSAYGLFQRPVPLHTTLILKPGDWRETEMISETRNGFYIEGVAVAMLERGYIRIVPDSSFTVENGELSEAIRIREVKIPIANLKTVNAISRALRIRVSREREWIIAEKAPCIRLEAFVM